MMMFFLYVVLFLFSFLFTFFLSPFFISMAHRYKLLDYPSEDRKHHKNPTPNIGGVILFLSFWSSVILGLFLHIKFKSIPSVLQLPHFFQSLHSWKPEIIGVFLGSLLITLVGWFDDRLKLNPLPKLIAQGLAAGILLSLGLKVNLVQDLGFLGFFITFIWVVLLMNAFNFIDSIDGHCLGIAIISCTFFFLMTQIVKQSAIAVLIIVLLGSFCGFFPYNFKPAKSFLGDSGSLFIGYMMAVVTLLCRYNTGYNPEITPLIPILLFGVPIYDTLSVVIVRASRGIPPWKGDRNHFAHRLVKLGMGERNAALLSYFIALSLGLLALLTTQIKTALGNTLVILLFFSVIAIIAFLEFYAAQRIRWAEEMADLNRRRKDDIPMM